MLALRVSDRDQGADRQRGEPIDPHRGRRASPPSPPLRGALHENSRFLVKAQSFRAGKNSYELLAPIHNRLR
jgi:hypothetical protein